MNEKITAQKLALYPNCQCVIVEQSVTTGEEIKTPATIEGFDFVLNKVISERRNWNPEQIKPILRPLSGLTGDEAKELYVLISEHKTFMGRIELKSLKDDFGELLKIFVYNNGSEEISDVIQIDKAFNVTDDYGNFCNMVKIVDWARSKCFDIDYLIEDGLAYTSAWTCCDTPEVKIK